MGKVIAGISIAGIEANYQNDRIPELAEKVITAAQEISNQLGY